MRPQAVGDMRGVARVILPAIEDHAHLAVARECLNEMSIEIRLAPRYKNEPSLVGLAIQVLLFRFWYGLHIRSNAKSKEKAMSNERFESER